MNNLAVVSGKIHFFFFFKSQSFRSAGNVIQQIKKSRLIFTPSDSEHRRKFRGHFAQYEYLCTKYEFQRRKDNTKFVDLSKERPMVIDSLNLNLSQISLFTHIYVFMDFNRFVDLQISADLQI